MFKNYFITAVRNAWRNKVFSVINIFGLALGITSSLLILLWVQDEYSVDAFHKNGAQLYLVYERQLIDGKANTGYYTPGPLAEELKKKFPVVEYASSSRPDDDEATVEAGQKILKLRGNFAGADFFKMFSYPLLIGKAEKAFNSPAYMAISRRMAEEFFGSPENAMGKTVRYENEKQYTVSAVFENLPTNASDKFEYLISWSSFLEDHAWAKDWDGNSPRTAVMLRPGADPVAFEKSIKDLLKDHHKNFTSKFKIELGLQRYGDRYLHGDFKNGYVDGGRIDYVKIFSISAIVILLIACINFMNLTTAHSLKRAKEIGVRKVSGAVRSSIIKQFMSEALLFTVLAVIVALLMARLVLPAFNSFTGKQIKLPFYSSSFWLQLSGLTFVTAFISGSYPALFLSSFKPVSVLKGAIKFGPGITLFRKGLVVFQFALSITLIIATIVISQQVSYIQSKNIGFEKDNLVYVPLEGDLPGKYQVFKQEVLKQTAVAGVTRITNVPTQIGFNTIGVDWPGKDPNAKPIFFAEEAGYDFLKTMKLQLSAGRDFSRSFAADSANYLLNESAVQKIGYTNPVGKPFSMWGVKGQIIGVVKDFHFSSLHDAIQPLIIKLGEKEDWGYALVRVKAGSTKQALTTLETICKTLNPKFPFTYQFADDDYKSLYSSEQVVNKLADYFSFLAIFISCLGLLGLAIFTAEQRTKEIGIRKAIGATASDIIAMLSKDIVKLVIISSLIASPVAWFFTNNWLQGYVYRIHISWYVFVAAGLVVVVIALATVLYQAVKAATTNPVKSLRAQ